MTVILVQLSKVALNNSKRADSFRTLIGCGEGAPLEKVEAKVICPIRIGFFGGALLHYMSRKTTNAEGKPIKERTFNFLLLRTATPRGHLLAAKCAVLHSCTPGTAKMTGKHSSNMSQPAHPNRNIEKVIHEINYVENANKGEWIASTSFNDGENRTASMAKKRRRARADVWEFIVKICKDNGAWVHRCERCGFIFAFSSSKTTLQSHLQ